MKKELCTIIKTAYAPAKPKKIFCLRQSNQSLLVSIKHSVPGTIIQDKYGHTYYETEYPGTKTHKHFTIY